MLVIGRKEMERIFIRPPGAPTIILQICSIGSGKVVLGIEAPREVRILREELIHACNESTKVAGR